MTPLEAEIRAIVANEGPITVERYMALALGHPTYGYYMSRDPLGASGDFTTAPEVSQMFGELIGLWVAEVWTTMGAPSPVHLVELGPGRGTLMMDALRAARVVPGLLPALRVHLVETSPVLIESQRQALARSGASIEWRATLDEVPDGPAVILANEFFDALPVRHYVRTERGWCERMVGIDAQGALVFGVAETPEPALKVAALPGTILEIGATAHQLMARLAGRLVEQGGACLVVDYGHTETSLGETLQALKSHRFVDPLETPGDCDLTAHIDFAALGRAARSAGAAVLGPVTQARFLAGLGIFERAEGLKRNATPLQSESIDSALLRLVGEDDVNMGTLFKAIAVLDPTLPAPAGFADPDQS